MTTERSAAATTAASVAAEAIRSFNHATLRRGELSVVDVYGITADLAAMASRLRQSCDQLAAILEHRLEHRLERGELRADDGSDAGVLIAEAEAELRFAGAYADDLGRALSATQNWLARISDGAY